MKLLVIGASGLIGSHVWRAARAAGAQAIGTYRKFARPGLVRCDGGDAAALAGLLREHQPEAVVYTAGLTWADACEDDPPRAFEENALQPERCAHLCHSQGIHFTYLSTSYVFDGTKGPYTEDNLPNPISVYSSSKRAGELRVQEACAGAALIPRVICVYGAEAQQKNFAYQVWRALLEGKTLRLPSDQLGNPTWAADLACWLLKLIERREQGVWHLASPLPNCSRPQWAEMLVKEFEAAGIPRHPAFAVQAVPTAELKQKARRPLHAGMLIRKLARLRLPATAFSESIAALVRQDRDWYSDLR